MLLLNVFHLFFTESDPTAYVEPRLLSTSTIRHCHCEIAVAKENSRCQACISYRRCLRIMLTRLESRTELDKENRTAPCSRVNYCHLTTPEKNRRLSRLHSSLRSANRQIARLKARLEEANKPERCWTNRPMMAYKVSWLTAHCRSQNTSHPTHLRVSSGSSRWTRRTPRPLLP